MVYVTAFFEAVNEFESNIFPSLHNRREAQARQREASKQGGEGCVINRILRSHRSRRSRARSASAIARSRKSGFPTAAAVSLSIGKPPRPRVSGGFAIFVTRSATPPCGHARRGILHSYNSFTTRGSLTSS